MEGIIAVIAAAIAVILIAMEKRGGNNRQSRYDVRETEDDRFCEVVDNENGETVFVGTAEQCGDWIGRNE